MGEQIDAIRELLRDLQHENLLIKVQRDELLAAAKAIHRYREWDKSYPYELEAWDHLEATIAKIEGCAS